MTIEFNSIKWAYQRIVRGYDDRIYWGFESYFIKCLPALKKYCSDYIDGRGNHELNPLRSEICKNTLFLIDDWVDKECSTSDDLWGADDEKLAKMFEYIGKNINWYWA